MADAIETLILRRTRVWEGIAPDAIPFDRLIAEQIPTILKGVARDFPLTRAGLCGARAAMDHIAAFWSGRPITGYTAAPHHRGRYGYDQSVTQLDFEGASHTLPDYFAQIAAHFDDPAPPSFYIGSTDLDIFLPGLRAESGVAIPPSITGEAGPVVSIWMGNRTTAAAHYDMSNNLACCMVGRRRFTLFPPDQVANLYPGPLEPTPGGQVVTMVDFRDPDLDRYPRFREAMAAGEVAVLEPGDLLFYPALWWHQVDALEPFNAMINYWWNAVPRFMDTPMNTLLHGVLSLRDRPETEKAAWRALFDYYVFGPADRAGAHLPDAARGALATPLDPIAARRLRADLLRRLNR